MKNRRVSSTEIAGVGVKDRGVESKRVESRWGESERVRSGGIIIEWLGGLRKSIRLEQFKRREKEKVISRTHNMEESRKVKSKE